MMDNTDKSIKSVEIKLFKENFWDKYITNKKNNYSNKQTKSSQTMAQFSIA